MLNVDRAALALGIPAVDVARCKEASHDGMHRLVQMQDKTFVQHTLSLEIKELPQANGWWLRGHEGKNYVQSDSQQAIWVKDLLHTSLFVAAGPEKRMFMWTQKIGVQATDVYMWLDEMSHRHSIRQLSIQLHHDGFTV
eukprot:6106627-Amphidinium_carterae.1